MGVAILPSLGNLGMDYRVTQTRVQVPALSLTSHTASCKLVNFFEL